MIKTFSKKNLLSVLVDDYNYFLLGGHGEKEQVQYDCYEIVYCGSPTPRAWNDVSAQFLLFVMTRSLTDGQVLEYFAGAIMTTVKLTDQCENCWPNEIRSPVVYDSSMKDKFFDAYFGPSGGFTATRRSTDIGWWICQKSGMEEDNVYHLLGTTTNTVTVSSISGVLCVFTNFFPVRRKYNILAGVVLGIFFLLLLSEYFLWRKDYIPTKAHYGVLVCIPIVAAVIIICMYASWWTTIRKSKLVQVKVMDEGEHIFGDRSHGDIDVPRSYLQVNGDSNWSFPSQSFLALPVIILLPIMLGVVSIRRPAPDANPPNQAGGNQGQAVGNVPQGMPRLQDIGGPPALHNPSSSFRHGIAPRRG